MRMSLRNTLKWLAYLVIGSIVMYLITDFVLNTDNSKQAIEQFISGNEEVVAKVGNVKEIELIKKVSVSATETSSPYRLYTFLIDGDKGKATVVVQVEQTDQADIQERYQITKLNQD